MRVTMILIVTGVLGTVTKAREKTEGIGIKRMNRNHPDHSILRTA